MGREEFIDPKRCGLLVIDVQERLWPKTQQSDEVAENIVKVINGFHLFRIPIIATEQVPDKIGSTIPLIKECFGSDYHPRKKEAFSCMADPLIRQEIIYLPIDTWVVTGIEAHVCVFQTVKDLVAEGKKVIVLNDCISSRSLFDYSTAIAEMRDLGVRISSSEIILFELLRTSSAPQFKEISQLVR
jgi:nicotinamidase-related amidase